MKAGKILLAALLAACLFIACEQSQHEEAKKRVLEKKDVTESVKEREVALTQIDLNKIGSDIKELEKIILMTQEEIAKRLGSYKFDSDLTYITDREGKSLKLYEKQHLTQAKNGDFYLKLSNDKSLNLEMYWTGGKLYDRTGYGNFREMTSTGKHLFWREKIYNALDRFYKYFRGHLQFTKPEEVKYEGRPALKIGFVLDPTGKTPQENLETKYNFPNQYALSAIASDKLVNKNRKRVSRYERAKGHLIIDKQEKCILAYELEAKYAIPFDEQRIKHLKESGVKEPGKEIIFTMNSQYEIKEIGHIEQIKKPEAKPAMKRKRPPRSPRKLLPEGSKPGPAMMEQKKMLQQKPDDKKKAKEEEKNTQP